MKIIALATPTSAATPDDDVATMLATIIAAERFECIAKGSAERLVDYYQYETGFDLADFTSLGRHAALVQLHLKRALEFDRNMGRQFTCKAMLEILARFL